MTMPPPLRFLGAVLGGWTCLRVAMLVPGWAGAPEASRPLQPRAPGPLYVAQAPPAAASPPDGVPPLVLLSITGCSDCESIGGPTHLSVMEAPASPPPPIVAAAHSGPPAMAAFFAQPEAAPTYSQVPPLARLVGQRPWSASAWAFIRDGDAQSLAAGGTLGGSQVGARFGYRLNDDSGRPLALSLRLSSPMRRPKGAEAALGLQWKPLASIPVRLLAERRQALGREGRSAFSLMAHGGISDAKVIGPFRASAYGQAGVVGVKSRDMFADGAASFTLPLDEGGRISIGAGAWAAVQPGVSRIDVGPSVRLRMPLRGQSVSLSAEWRMRVAGNAAPGSGPTLTIATGF